MEGKQLTLDDLLTTPPTRQTKSNSTKAEKIDLAFLMGASLLMEQWGVPKNTRQLALGILSHGNKRSNSNDASDVQGLGK